MCTRDGHVFDILAIVPYVKQHGSNPCTGAKLQLSELIRLSHHRNAGGNMHCPVTFKEFTRHSHIVAIATSGNVYGSRRIVIPLLCVKCVVVTGTLGMRWRS
jgi:peptidyl-prolyl cis-trans isomerase-like protein 2